MPSFLLWELCLLYIASSDGDNLVMTFYIKNEIDGYR